jgi:hypothetical protein
MDVFPSGVYHRLALASAMLVLLATAPAYAKPVPGPMLVLRGWWTDRNGPRQEVPPPHPPNVKTGDLQGPTAFAVSRSDILMIDPVNSRLVCFPGAAVGWFQHSRRSLRVVASGQFYAYARAVGATPDGSVWVTDRRVIRHLKNGHRVWPDLPFPASETYLEMVTDGDALMVSDGMNNYRVLVGPQPRMRHGPRIPALGGQLAPIMSNDSRSLILQVAGDDGRVLWHHRLVLASPLASLRWWGASRQGDILLVLENADLGDRVVRVTPDGHAHMMSHRPGSEHPTTWGPTVEHEFVGSAAGLFELRMLEDGWSIWRWPTD